MQEYIEMATNPTPSTSKQPPPMSLRTYTFSEKSPVLVEKVVKRDHELRPFTTKSISYLWVISPVFCYFAVLVGGIMTSIGVGNVFAAFDSYCIFNANFTLQVTINETTGKPVPLSFFANSWGEKTDCLFTMYGSVAVALFSGVWIVMVLQCGRGGASKRGFRLPDAWRIVPPTCVLNTTVFIISCIILSSVTSGFGSFCENSVVQYNPPDENRGKLSCEEMLSFRYSLDKFHTNLVQQSYISKFGATIQFIGCLIGFLIVILRCCTGPDFDLYVRREIAYIPANTDEEKACYEERTGIMEEDEDEDDEEFADCRDNGDSAYPEIEVTTAEVISHPEPQPIAEEEISDGSITSRTGLILN